MQQARSADERPRFQRVGPGRAASVRLPRLALALLTVLTTLAVSSRPGAGATSSSTTAIDTSFGGGFVRLDQSPVDDEAFAVAVQPNGSTVVAGRTGFDQYQSTGGDIVVSRYTTAGQLDSSFGSGGSVVLGVPATVDAAKGLALQPDGKILVAAAYNNHPAIVRLTPAGALDAGFHGGIVTIDEVKGSANAVGVAGLGDITFSGDGVILGHLNQDGSRALLFGSNGVVAGSMTFPTGAYAGATVSTAYRLLAGGGVLIGGYHNAPTFGPPTDFGVLARYLPSGAPDGSFGTGGMVTVDLDTPYVSRGTQISSVTVQPDGKLVAAGSVYMFGSAGGPGLAGIRHMGLADVAVFRYLPDGRPDPSFGWAGHVVTKVPGTPGSGGEFQPGAAITPVATDSKGLAVHLDASGNVLVGGRSAQPYVQSLVLRYTAWGILDTTFGHGGVLSANSGEPMSWINAMTSASDGRLVVAGISRTIDSVNSGELLVGRIRPGSSTGSVWAWGWNGLGQLGDGTTTDRRTPVRVSGLSGVVRVSASPYHTLALRGDGTVWAWGWNAYGELGTGDTSDRRTPVKIPGLTGIVAVAAGGVHSLAVAGDGTVWAWGYNGTGQLGDGTTQSRLTPVRVAGLSGIISISAGLFHNLAIREDGSGWAWGYNGTGQIGDGTTIDRRVPVQLPENWGNWAYGAVSAGWLHSLSTDVTAQIVAWGWNGLGQVNPRAVGGNVPTPASSAPTPMGMYPFAGGYHSLQITPYGGVVSFGWNAYGQLGHGPETPYVSGLTDARSASAGGVHSLAITADHRLLAWGFNYYGQLGTGAAADAGAPIEVTALPNVTTVSAGGFHSVATAAT